MAILLGTVSKIIWLISVMKLASLDYVLYFFSEI